MNFSYCWENNQQSPAWWATSLKMYNHQTCAFCSTFVRGAQVLIKISQHFLIPIATVVHLPERTGRLSAREVASDLDFTLFFFFFLLSFDCTTWNAHCVCSVGAQQLAHSCSVTTAARLVFCWHLVLNLQCQWVEFFFLTKAPVWGEHSSLVSSQRWQFLHIYKGLEGHTADGGVIRVAVNLNAEYSWKNCKGVF